MSLGEGKMGNWRIVGRIAAGFGIVFVVFSIFSAILTYNVLNLQPGYYPLSYIISNVFFAMLNPYLLLAALSFVVAWFSIHAENEASDLVEEEALPKAEPQNL